MQVWHILPEYAYQKFIATGTISGDGRRVWSCFRKPYAWMIAQMKLRIGEPPPGIKYPIWIWKQHDEFSAKPDLRRKCLLSPGTKGYRLTLDIDPEDILLSDFGRWHSVLNNVYLADTEKEYDQFYEIDCTKLSKPEQQTLLEKSWEKIFDLTSPLDEEWYGEKFPTCIQGTVWQLRTEYITKVESFIAR